MKITKEPVVHTVFMVTDLVIGFEYEFRIIAVNLAGEGTPGQSCSPFGPSGELFQNTLCLRFYELLFNVWFF